MSRRDVDEAAVLKLYGISSLQPHQWELVDHDKDGPLAGALTGEDGSIVEGVDPLGLRGRLTGAKDLDIKTRAATSLSSKAFDPKVFLSTYHPDASYADLRSSISHLERAIESRSEAVRILVEENFDRFVAVKACSDVVSRDMREGFLAEDTDHGTRELREIFKVAGHRADQVFLPVLENAVKAQKLRSTLGVFEKSKFLFNLPGSLLESINWGKYDQALRDYKKGVFLKQTKTGQYIPGVAATTPQQKEQQKRVFDKVWTSVEKIMGDMRVKLDDSLRDPSRSVEEQERTIEILGDLEQSDEPAWAYLEYQHAHILETMRKTFKKASDDARLASQHAAEQPSTSTSHIDLLRRQLAAPAYQLSALQPTPGETAWLALQALIKQYSEYVLRSLPGFWKVAKACMDGKYRKRDTSGILHPSRRSASTCRAMATEIIKTFTSTISQFFSLSDISHAGASSREGEPTPMPSFVPAGTSVLTACFFAERLIDDMAECAIELYAIDVGPDALAGLKGMMDSLRWRMVEAISATWAADAKVLHALEDWQPSATYKGATKYLAVMETLQNRVLSSAKKVASRANDREALLPVFKKRIKDDFVDTLCFCFDGLLSMATAPPELNNGRRPSRVALARNTSKDTDTRLLMTLAQFVVLRTQVVPAMIGKVGKTLDIDTTHDMSTLVEVLDNMDDMIFRDYTRLKAQPLAHLMEEGILRSGMDWYNAPKPTEVRPYMHRAILQLVDVHAKIGDIASSLVPRVLETLVIDATQAALKSFRQVPRFGMGGMLTSTLEIEFFHQSVSQYANKAADEILSDIYDTISSAYKRQGDPDEFQRELASLKKLLSDSRKATGMETLCFKQPRKDKDGVGLGVMGTPVTPAP